MKTTLTALTLAAALGCGLAAPALAGDSAEDRFHAAYVQEVVDGQVADAAKAYLALTTSDDAPAAIRREARFRFAVCTVLLGRVDEARLQLGELLRDAEADASFKARVREYLDALQDVGMGKALDKKLQELTFELGRHTPYGVELEQYRDIEVIGDAARPFLRDLLGHSDATLRAHAFRLLLRMNEPGMATRIPRDSVLTHNEMAETWTAYAARHEGAQKALEEALLALSDDALHRALGKGELEEPTVLKARLGDIAWSAPFLEALLRRGWPTESIVAACLAASTSKPHFAIFERLLRSDDDALSEPAARGLLQHLRWESIEPRDLPADLFLVVLRGVLRREPWNITANTPGNDTAEHYGFSLWAAALPRTQMIEASELCLSDTTPRHAGWTMETVDATLLRDLVHRLCTDIRGAGPGDDSARLVQLTLRSIETVRAALYADGAEPSERRLGLSGGSAVALLQALAPHVDAATGATLFERALAKPDWTARGWLVAKLPFETEAQRTRIRDELLALSARQQSETLAAWTSQFRRRDGMEWPEGLAALVAETCDDLLRGSKAEVTSLVQILRKGVLPDVLEDLPPEDARRALADILATVDRPATDAQEALIKHLLSEPAQNRRGTKPTGASPTTYLDTVVIPALDDLHTALARSERLWILFRECQSWLYMDQTGQVELGAGRERIAEFLLTHLDGTLRWATTVLSSNSSLFPPARWVPRVPQDAVPRTGVRYSEAPAVIEACQALLQDPGPTNRSVVRYVLLALPGHRSAELLAPLVRAGDAATVSAIFTVTDNLPPDILASTLERFGTDPALDEEALRTLVVALNRVRPSTVLFPAVRRLLRSDDVLSVRTGIEVAQSLGRRELVPDLINLLDSLDGERRTAARAAIDSILELDRLRNEAKIMDKLGGTPAEEK